MNLILFGFKGVGKTYFGQLLAKELNLPFIDTDALLEELFAKKTTYPLPIRKIYATLGEKQFRLLEKETLQTLENVQNSVIALGGGAILTSRNGEFLRKIGTLVYLQASAAAIKQRIFKEGVPSFLDSKDPDGSFLKMFQAREPIYESIPARRVDTDGLSKEDILNKLRSMIEVPQNGF